MLRLLLLASVCLVGLGQTGFHEKQAKKRSFTIDFDHDIFSKDGKPFHYIAGIMHYFRIPHFYWTDRLYKMFAAGMDAVQTYVAWNLHEPMPGVYDFGGQQNLTSFLTAAQEVGLLVILRVGPYICAEWDYGGFPAWLLSDNETMIVRTMDKKYLAAVDRWLSVLLPLIKPYLYSEGGPIIMVQMENEYGSYKEEACSPRGPEYLRLLRDTFLHYLGSDFVLFTADGSTLDYLKCGTVEGAYPTVNFAPDPDPARGFDGQRKHNPKGPLVDSECYTAWLDSWGGRHHFGDVGILVAALKANYAYNASTSLYMFAGGTNFGYMNGDGKPTSYDYDGPLSEAGDVTPKFWAIRNFTSTLKKSLPVVPENKPKYVHGPITMEKIGSVVDLMPVISSSAFRTIYPLNMEQANHFYGFILYRHVLTRSYSSKEFKTAGVRDRGYVLINGQPSGYLDHETHSFQASGQLGQVVDIIIENQGRVNYGYGLNDNKKGLISNVTFDGEILSNWEMYPLNFTKIFDHLDRFKNRNFMSGPNGKLVRTFQRKPMEPMEPTVYKGEFVLNSVEPLDTFLQMCGWVKGQAFINGFNLGRYWPVQGPQVTLYVPGGILYPAPKPNIIVMLELEHSPSTGSKIATDFIRLVKDPILDARCFNSTVLERFARYQNPQHFKYLNYTL